MQQASQEAQISFTLNTARLDAMRESRDKRIINTLAPYKFSSSASDEMPGQMPETEAEAIAWVRGKYSDGGCQFGMDNLKSGGVYKLMGWCFSFRPYLRKFVYKQYGSWAEAYAPNKTLLRKIVFGRIDQILEVK